MFILSTFSLHEPRGVVQGGTSVSQGLIYVDIWLGGSIGDDCAYIRTHNLLLRPCTNPVAQQHYLGVQRRKSFIVLGKKATLLTPLNRSLTVLLGQLAQLHDIRYRFKGYQKLQVTEQHE